MHHYTIRLRALCLAATCVALATPVAFAQVSDYALVHKVTLTAGANFVSAPVHHQAAFSGTVASVSGDVISFVETQNWTVDQFGPFTLPGASSPSAQYILLVTKDASTSPGVAGDWWPVQSNTASTVTLSPDGDTLSAILGVGDKIEVRPLISLADLFGTGASVAITKDNDLDPVTSQEDIIRTLAGTSFVDSIFYHDGSLDTEGWYVNGSLVDASQVRFNPGEPLMFFRKTGAAALNVAFKGRAQTTRLTTFVKSGANPVGVVYPVNSPIGTNNLLESGLNTDNDLDPVTSQEDLGRGVAGTSFTSSFFYHDGSLDTAGWYVNGSLDPAFAFEPTKGYFLFRKTGTGTLRWREAVPFAP